MKKTANARFTIKSWDEKPYSEGKDLPKMTRATVVKTSYSVVTGSGTGELRSLRGEGTSSAGHEADHPFSLNYELH
jgi:hypothetical protein